MHHLSSVSEFMKLLLARVPLLGLVALGCALPLSACDQGSDQDALQETIAGEPVSDTPQGAYSLGALPQSMPELAPHEVTLTQRTDFFRFSVSRYGQVQLRLHKEHEAALFLIVWELGADGGRGPAVIDFWQVEPTEDHKVVLPEGEFLLEVKNRSEHWIPYELGLAIAPAQGEESTPDPGAMPETAKELGLLGDDVLELSGYVGIVDQVDYYRVQVPAQSKLKVQGASEEGAFEVTLIDAQNENTGAALQVESRSGMRQQWEFSEAGEYLVRVQSRSRHGAMYQVTLDLDEG